MFAAIGGWLLKTLLSRSTGQTIQRVMNGLLGTPDGQAKLEEIRAGVDVALAKEETARQAQTLQSLDARQQAKMNQTVFWTIILVMMGPPALIIWSVAIYNILFWRQGIFPQTWAIADFPPSIKPWVQMSIDWLYDPVGAPGTVVSAGIASWLTRRSR